MSGKYVFFACIPITIAVKLNVNISLVFRCSLRGGAQSPIVYSPFRSMIKALILNGEQFSRTFVLICLFLTFISQNSILCIFREPFS